MKEIGKLVGFLITSVAAGSFGAGAALNHYWIEFFSGILWLLGVCMLADSE